MPQNQIQFQHGMSLSEFIERYGTESQCERALERSPWLETGLCARGAAGRRTHGSSPTGASTGSAGPVAPRAPVAPARCFMPPTCR
jgi:hypothetical protein